jgi:2-polyprenyl-3-methyl-5-hydroxy-6-metoxy-1,4-benzoquinol methylase
VRALEAIRYRLNSNDFHFDTEIIIQLLNAGLRIIERPIPTYYGDEICRVNGVKYAKDVISATLQNVAHRSGLLYQRRFEPQADGNAHYDLKLGYDSSHTYALGAVGPGSRVLDIGSGPGGLARELRKQGCEVAVVDQHAPTVPTLDVKVITQNLNEPPKFDVAGYDTLLLLDVIEHLQDPEEFLQQLRSQFDHNSKRLVFSTPNVAFIVQRLMLLIGQFNYGKAGILDRTHTRLFTFRAAEHLLRDAGFRIQSVKGVPAPFPKVLGEGLLGRGALKANLALIRVSRTLFSYQIFIEATSTPDVNFLVDDARVNSARHEQARLLRVARSS